MMLGFRAFHEPVLVLFEIGDVGHLLDLRVRDAPDFRAFQDF